MERLLQCLNQRLSNLSGKTVIGSDDMDQEFERKVIEDLEKSGFSSELRAIRTFISSGWNCTEFANFLDVDQEMVTSIDLLAWQDKFVSKDNLRYGVQFNINAEVKKSEKPWVVFKEMSLHVNDDYINNLTHICGLTPFDLRQSMSAGSVYAKLGWRGYSIHESFKKPDAPSRSYSAFVKVCKSAESRLSACSAYYKEHVEHLKQTNNPDPYKERVVVFVKPVVILDGKLIAASMLDTGEVSIEEIKFAPVEFYYTSKHCTKGVYLVDIVTLDNLQEYIDISKKRQLAIFDKVESLSEKGLGE